MKPFRVMFVCLGNICRSPVAHAVFEDLVRQEGLDDRISVESSGTGAWHLGEPADSRMRRTARKHGVTIDHRARAFSPADFREYDLILAMDRQNYRDIMSRGSAEDREKVRMFRDFDPAGSGDVPDPYYGGPEGFEDVYRIVERTARALLDEIRTEVRSA